MNKTTTTTIALLMTGLLSQGCSESSRRPVPGAATAAATSTSSSGITGAYLGAYASNSGAVDSGKIGIVVNPDLTFRAIAVSDLDEDVRDAVEGRLNPDGTIQSLTAATGTAFTFDLPSLTGTYSSNHSSGTFQLRRPPAGDPVVGCYGGTSTNDTLGISGVWMATVDELHRVHALYYYPTSPLGPYLSSGVYGAVTPDGSGGYTVDASNTSNTLSGSGTLSGGTFSGTWQGNGQSGTWTGTRLQ